MAAFSRLLDILARIVILLASAAMVLLVVITGWMVFGRYVLNDTPTWVERAATLIVITIVLPVAAVGVRERFHLSVLGFREALPERARWGVELACDILVGLFGLAMAWWSLELVQTSQGIRIPLLGISMIWTYLPLTLCGVLVALFALEQALLALRHRHTAARPALALE
ncbi:TRAP transporter small permease [Pseudoroseomonas cervicalis]|uniref:TRAP transporter small permease protein n=1 Tax=Pseudoroseomonas cervicalis ATCC 49957 TaxID=525371 RepID=D5RKU1_9PROT|nr:TRAP transporter small permease [Pseudoroseomonas cervicalis]EFH12076.1 TRAP transporter, DctQ-like membrane protein [Pseudoroseomonas cervicalis ATCC 49957]